MQSSHTLHHFSRFVLAIEVVLLVFPVLAVALLLGALFAGAWMPIAVFALATEPTTKKVLHVGAVWFMTAGSMVHLVSVSSASFGYIRRGRSAIQALPKTHRMLLFVGPLFPALCCLLTTTPGELNGALMLMLPGLLLLMPSAHLICACWIADFWASRAGGSTGDGRRLQQSH